MATHAGWTVLTAVIIGDKFVSAQCPRPGACSTKAMLMISRPYVAPTQWGEDQFRQAACSVTAMDWNSHSSTCKHCTVLIGTQKRRRACSNYSDICIIEPTFYQYSYATTNVLGLLVSHKKISWDSTGERQQSENYLLDRYRIHHYVDSYRSMWTNRWMHSSFKSKAQVCLHNFYRKMNMGKYRKIGHRSITTIEISLI